MGRILEKRLAEAGYRLLGGTENKEELILDLLKTKDARYLKAIPFLIYQYNKNNNHTKDSFSYLWPMFE